MSTPTTPKQRGKRSRAETPASAAESPSTPKQSAKRTRSDAISSATKSPSAQTALTPPSQPRSRRGDQTSSPLPLAPSSPFTNSQQEQSNNSSELDATSPLNYGTPASTVGGSVVSGTPHGATPLRSRQDVRSVKKMRQVNVGGSDPLPSDSNDVGPSSDVAAEPKMVIWGTDVVVSETQERFKRFLLTFIDESEGETDVNFDPTKPLYLQKLEEITITEEPFLNLDCTHLKAFLPDLQRQLICYPQEVIPTFDLAVNELFYEHFPETELLHQIQVRTFNVDKTVNMRSLNPEDIDQLITVSGMIIRTSELIPEMREAHFRCHVCHFSVSVEIERGEINEPAACANCSTQQSMSLVHNRSHFTDKQMVKMQESPDDMPAGQTQHTIIMYAYNDLVDGVQPGDRVTVTGIFRATPLRQNPRHRNVNAVYKTYVDVIHFQKKDKRKLHERDSDSQLAFSEERVKYLESLSKMHDIYERLSKALAPSIYENMDIKKGILLQLFGGTAKDFTDAGRGKFRSDMNILLCGDPGTSKSQLLQYVHNLIPRGQYVSGKGSSAVGLTAYVTRDPETGQLCLQPGALVLSDNGICCIDEFDKMSDGTKAVLHEVMEQQTLSIAKAGIICQLNARTAILAAANPVRSQWDASLTTVENIQLSHTLLSRFDLIFLILDPQDEAFDRRLATHLVSLYHMTEREVDESDVDMGTLKDYIAYAKNNIKPRLNEEASQGLIHAYVDMRKAGSSRGAVSAYPRQLESLIRLSEAHAKMRFAESVNIADVEEAKRLHREALKQSAMDPKTGMIDINILTTGVSISDRKRRIDASKALSELINKSGKTQLPYMKLFEDFKDQAEAHVTRGLFDEALKILSDEDKINLTDDKKMIRVS